MHDIPQFQQQAPQRRHWCAVFEGDERAPPILSVMLHSVGCIVASTFPTENSQYPSSHFTFHPTSLVRCTVFEWAKVVGSWQGISIALHFQGKR